MISDDKKKAVESLEQHANAALKRALAPLPMPFYIPKYYKDPEGHRAAIAPLLADGFYTQALACAYRVFNNDIYLHGLKRYLNHWGQEIVISEKDDSPFSFLVGFSTLIDAAIIAGLHDNFFLYQTYNTFDDVCDEFVCKLNNQRSWALYGKALIKYYCQLDGFVPADYHITLKKEIEGHFRFSLNKNKDFWVECLRTNSGMWYTYFSLAPLIRAVDLIERGGVKVRFDKGCIDRYFSFCDNPRKWPPKGILYKRYPGVLGKIQGALFPSEDALVLPDPGNWPYNLFEILAGKYGIKSWDRWVAPHRPHINGHLYQFATVKRIYGL